MHCRIPILLAAAFAGALSACKVMPPEPEEWLEVGFRSPEQAFRTYQAALASDMPDLEYRCLGTYFKNEHQLNQMGYRSFREQELGRRPWLRYLAEAEITSSRPLPDGLWQIEARVKYLWKVVDVSFTLGREDYYELWAGDELWTDGPTNFDTVLSVDDTSGDLTLGVPAPEDGIEAPNDEGLTEVRVGREWKIQVIEQLEKE